VRVLVMPEGTMRQLSELIEEARSVVIDAGITGDDY
jgi:hypothetical protein